MPGQKLIPGLVLDTSEEGLGAFWNNWQKTLMEELWKQPNMTSCDAYEYLREKGVRTTKSTTNTVSRASVITFLNRQAENGVLTYSEETCKGGSRRRYRPAMNSDQFAENAIFTIRAKLSEIFPQQKPL